MNNQLNVPIYLGTIKESIIIEQYRFLFSLELCIHFGVSFIKRKTARSLPADGIGANFSYNGCTINYLIYGCTLLIVYESNDQI